MIYPQIAARYISLTKAELCHRIRKFEVMGENEYLSKDDSFKTGPACYLKFCIKHIQMKRADYIKAHEAMELIRKAGSIIASSNIPLQQQTTILAPISDAVSTLNAEIAKGRPQAESEIFIEPTTLRGFFQNIVNYLKND